MTDLYLRVAALEQKLAGTMLPIAVYGNENNQERVTEIPLSKGAPFMYRRVLLAKTGQVRAGDMFVALSEFQVTSEHLYNVMLGCQIWVTEGSAYGGEEVTEATAQNFNRSEHHFTRTKVGIWTATADYDFRYFNMWAWAASDASATGDTIEVNQDYGRLSVIHCRPFASL